MIGLGHLAHGALGGLNRRQPAARCCARRFPPRRWRRPPQCRWPAPGRTATALLMLKTQREHHGERADQRHGHGGQRNDRRAPRLEKEDDDHHDQQHGLQPAYAPPPQSNAARKPSGHTPRSSPSPSGKFFFSSSIVRRTSVDSCRALAPGVWKIGSATAVLLSSSERRANSCPR